MTPTQISRRRFLRNSSASLALAAALPPAALARRSARPAENGGRRLAEGWTFRRGPLTPEQAGSGRGGVWQPVSLPHCTNAEDACDPDHPYFQGESWYRTQVQLENSFPGGHSLLHFHGAGQTARVWADGSLLATHVGGYDEFVVELPPGAGRAVDLLICCDSTPDQARSPSNLSDFCLYGGLYRHVDLVYLPAVTLDCIQIRQTTGPDGPATLDVYGRLFGARAAGTQGKIPVQVELLGPGGQTVSSRQSSKDAWEGLALLATIRVEDPQRWSPDTPYLYRCRVTLGSGADASVVTERLGIRHVSFPEQGLFSLNGKPLRLRGTQRHQDCAEHAGAQTDASVRQEMQLMKAMGANFVRLGHYQQDRLVLELCDELGLLVWEEVPWCRAGIGSERWQKSTRLQLERMIEQHFNHPSVAFWGLGNEDDWPEELPSVNTAAIRSFMAQLHARAHELDPGRLTSYRRCEFARDIPDVYSPSIWAGWYNGTYRDYAPSLQAERGKQKRLLHIEWGADSHAGRHSEDPYAPLQHLPHAPTTEERDGDYLRHGGPVRVSRDGDWSETYACDLFDWYLKTQEAMPWLAGSAQWVFKDFASPLRADSPIPRINQKGVLQRDLTPKESYAVFQSYWSKEPMIHIYGHSWPTRWGAAGEKRTVKVYSNCPEVELFLNGVSLGGRKRDSQNFPAANLRWEVPFRDGENTLHAVGLHGATRVEDTIGLHYESRPWSQPARLSLKEVSRQAGMVTVQAEVLDHGGRRCLDARTAVRFTASGGLSMLRNQGTFGGSSVLEVANGLAPLRVAGAGTITVSAQGLGEASLLLGSKEGKG